MSSTVFEMTAATLAAKCMASNIERDRRMAVERAEMIERLMQPRKVGFFRRRTITLTLEQATKEFNEESRLELIRYTDADRLKARYSKWKERVDSLYAAANKVSPEDIVMVSSDDMDYL